MYLINEFNGLMGVVVEKVDGDKWQVFQVLTKQYRVTPGPNVLNCDEVKFILSFITCVLSKKLLHNTGLQIFIPLWVFCRHRLYIPCIINIFMSKILFCSSCSFFFLPFFPS